MKHEIHKVLVTGGAGCIGMQVCMELVHRGFEVVLFDMPEQIMRIESHIPKKTQIYYGSILDRSSLRDAMIDCDGVIHLAAYLGVRRTETNRLRCMEINIKGTQNVLDVAIQNRVKKIAFASSSEVYGEPFENPISEGCITQGKTVYAVSKLAGEELCRAYAQRYPDFTFTILRYFNAYGPFQIAQFVIPKFIQSILEGKPPVIYGNGDQVRSYCYASDTAWATVEALSLCATDGEVLNIGNSKTPITLSQLAELIIRVCGEKNGLRPKYQKEFSLTDRTREREIFQRFCNTTKAERLINFAPKVSLEEGIGRVMKQGMIFPRWESTDLHYIIDDWV